MSIDSLVSTALFPSPPARPAASTTPAPAEAAETPLPGAERGGTVFQGTLARAQPADGGPPLGEDQFVPMPGNITFDQFLAGLNPLHHLPVVGMVYRAVTGEEVPPPMRVLGGAIFGGVPGMMVSAAMAAIEEFRPVGRMMAVLRGQEDPMFAGLEPDAAQRRQALAAYAQAGNLLSHG